MSAIGSYEVLTREGFAASLEAARNVRTEISGKWIFKTTEEKGREAFDAVWRASLVERVDFDYSGYVLGNYLDAQYEVNGLRLFDEESEPALALSKVFTAAFIFESPRTLPDLPVEKLEAFCRAEYNEAGPELIEPFQAAHTFYARGLSAITNANLVVFVIR
jgi:hypothetical protein